MSRPDSPKRFLATTAIVLGLIALSTAPASALSRGAYSMELLVDGVPLQEHHARSTAYVEALAGKNYSIRLTNHTGRRVAAAVSVDGLNTIDAKATSAHAAAKWILSPYETITLDGWQVSAKAARRFFFTTEERSYGAWLGKTDNLGIVSAAFFRERTPRPAPYSRQWEREERPSKQEGGRSGDRSKRRQSPSAAGVEAPTESRDTAGEDFAATGIGSKLQHRVQRVEFEAEPNPAAVLQLRYEYRDALVRLGVLPDYRAQERETLRRRERARGFDDLPFAPDPFRRR